MKAERVNPRDPQRSLRDFARYQTQTPPTPQTDADGVDSEGPQTEKGHLDIKFDMKPEELEAYLSQYVIKQDEAKAILATKICTHFNRIKLEEDEDEEAAFVGHIKNNILMIGPTGVGKTFLIKLIAKRIGVPFVKGDATKFSETGYVGGDVEDLVRDLVREADGDIDLAEYGIIYIDEIDKIASSGNIVGPDVSRTGVQRNLLKLMEETEVDLKAPHDIAGQMETVMQLQRTGKMERKKVNTKNILFIVSGAFNDLEEIIKKRLNERAMGFGADRPARVTQTEYLKQVRSEDLMKYGFESEFVGRLPVVAVLEELNVDDLYHILKNPHSSVIVGKKRDFKAYSIEVKFEDNALHLIAEQAYEERTGARGLVGVCEQVLLKFEKKLPSTNIKRFFVTKEVVEHPEEELSKLLTSGSIERFQEEFWTNCGIKISFDEKAVGWIIRTASQRGTDVETVCRERLADYGHGLKLISKKQFTVTQEVLEHPKDRLNELVKQFYGERR